MKGIATTYVNPPTEYWIVFTQGVHWFTKILKPNFSHIYLLTKDNHNWIILNPTRLYLQAEILPLTIDQDAPRMMAGHLDHVLKISFGQRDCSRRYGTMGMLNCVTWTKYMLGLPIYCLTPWRLYRKLLNFSARQMAHYGINSIRVV